MTGFSALRGSAEIDGSGWDWAWDLRSVNNRGLDLRLRLPDWVEGLEAAARAALQGRLTRGSVTLSLRLNRRDGTGSVRLDRAALGRAVEALAEVERAAEEAGITLQHSSGAEILGIRGILDASNEETDPANLFKVLKPDLEPLLAAFDAMRRSEGAALKAVLEGQLDRIGALTAEATFLAEARKDEVAATLKANMARVLENVEADPARLAQELALLAVKADVTEELDRLAAHVEAARALLAEGGPVGRKLDFLTQEFNREANTLCSKSGSVALTRVGLDLKAVIDQMREQVQNLE